MYLSTSYSYKNIGHSYMYKNSAEAIINKLILFKDKMPIYLRSSFNNGFLSVVDVQKYWAAKEFSEGMLAVRYSNGLLGFIDDTGCEVIPGKFIEVDNFLCGRARVCDRQKWFFIDKTGNKINLF